MTFVHLPLADGLVPDLPNKQYRGQRWYQSPNGQWYPSITTVLSNTGDKGGLDAWRKAIGGGEADRRIKIATDRGTAVHAMVELAIQNHPCPTDNHTREHIQAFNRLKLFLKKINNIRCQEQALYSNVLGVAGRVDLIADFEGKLSVIDFKTATKSKLDSMLLDYYLQETFYSLAYTELTGVDINDIVTMISVESEAAPQIKRKTIDGYISMLSRRIREFQSKFQHVYQTINQ